MREKSKLSPFRNSFKVKITDDGINEGEPKNSSIVGRVSAISKLFRLNDHNKDIFFKCVIEDLSSIRHSDRKEYFVSSAFGSGLMYVGQIDYVYEKEMNVILMQYMLTSPEFVPLEQNQLERQYVMTRRRISTSHSLAMTKLKNGFEQEQLMSDSAHMSS